MFRALLSSSKNNRRCARLTSSNPRLRFDDSTTRSLLRSRRTLSALSTSCTMRPSPCHCRVSSSMSTKPSYDFSEDDIHDDDDDPLLHEDNNDLQLKWIDRSQSLDNYMKYDNYSNYSAPFIDHKEESALLDILNANEALAAANSNQFLRHVVDEESMMMLLKNKISSNDYKGVNDMNEFPHDGTTLSDLLIEESSISRDPKYRELQKLQIQFETESIDEALKRSMSVWKSARDRSDHNTIPAVRRILNLWYASLTEVIELEQWLYLNGDYSTASSDHSECAINDEDSTDESNADLCAKNYKGTSEKLFVRDRKSYGALLCLLPARKIAIMLAHTALWSTVEAQSNGVKVIALAVQISNALETELNVSRAVRVRIRQRKEKLFDSSDESGPLEAPDMTRKASEEFPEANNNSQNDDVIETWAYTANHLQKFLNEIGGESGKQGQSSQRLGRVRPSLVINRCQNILLAEGLAQSKYGSSAPEKGSPIDDFVDWDPVQKVKLGAALIRILLDHTAFHDRKTAEPKQAFLYSRIGTKGNSRIKYRACITLHPELKHIVTKEELFSPDSPITRARLLSQTRCQPMVVSPKDWIDLNSGGYETLKVGLMRTRNCKTQKEVLHHADLSMVYEGLNVLGRIPWKVNKNVLDVATKCWDNGVVLGDIPPNIDYEVPPCPPKPEYREISNLTEEQEKLFREEIKLYKDGNVKHYRFRQKNMDLHSLRCAAMLKLGQARKFQDFEEIFFPYNVDFRGRAYPIPPHLSITGSDLCRGLLMFAHPKPLGRNGLYWLKVHLANLAGANKISFDGRAQFTDDNMDNVRAAVNDPFGENRWWMSFDDPFQGLATCHEIVQAIDSGDPPNYLCSLPVHMDGSCNGLQHYAALGRDKVGGKAVNLCIAEKPQDVYSGVMHEVIRRVALDAEQLLPFDENKSDLTPSEKDQVKKVRAARLVNGLIDRGVVKRTVMTSVYGVTFMGAKKQISEKIEEKLEGKGVDIIEIDGEIHVACTYLASLTMEVMGQLFTGARQTMNWLTACAKLISSQGQPVSFISPIGVPVVQPYRQNRTFHVVTLLQHVVLTNDSDMLPLHSQRQTSAFPPNFVHSLDSSHMLLTAIEMHRRGLYFSSVHDSYWTHPCDIEEMNIVLRECFIDLYNRPLLEDTKKRWEIRYPSIRFPDLPECGDLNLEDVRSAPYFFQ